MAHPRPATRRPKPLNRLTRRALQKRATRDRILKSARAIARREGLRAASVPRVMGGAGLTVGGFYAHFDSKVAMDAEIIRTMLGAPGRWLSGLDESTGLDWLARAVKRYLRADHRDSEDGCSFPGVLSEVARAPEAIRRAFVEAFEQRVKAFEPQCERRDGSSSRERALATMALTMGGVLLARATHGDPVSDDILEACRKWALPELSAAAGARSSHRAK